jgi:hypothetical protein
MLLAAVEEPGSGLRLNGLAVNPKNALYMYRAESPVSCID